MTARLLALLLLLAPSVIAQPAAKIPATCEVTAPKLPVFIPPNGYPTDIADNKFWFGSNRLWTLLPTDGIWRLGHYTPQDKSLWQKMFIWRMGFDPHAHVPPRLELTGKRLDGPAGPLKAQTGGAGWTHDDLEHSFMTAGVAIPTPGCWQITARFDEDELTFVVWIEEHSRP